MVNEELGFEPDHAGDHLLVRVRKYSANTHWVAECLANAMGVAARTVGFAGRKDRHGIATQWFSVGVRDRKFDNYVKRIACPEFEVIEAFRHRRKLKRGALASNQFEILVTDVEGDLNTLSGTLERIEKAGVPNYFGPQRFGHDGANLQLAEAFLVREERPPKWGQRSFALSAARSLLFNLVLSHRVEEGIWNRLLDGDVANLDGSRSVFTVPRVDAELVRRIECMDIHPTGPMWGCGALETAGRPREMELRICGSHPFAPGLVRERVDMARRRTRLPVRDLAWQVTGTAVRLEFRLAPGSYATSVLREIFDFRDVSGP